MRNARRLANGNYLVTHYGEQVVREYDPQGRPVWDRRGRRPHSAVRLPNGHTLIARGDMPGDPRVFEVDPGGQVVWEVSNDDLPGIS